MKLLNGVVFCMSLIGWSMQVGAMLRAIPADLDTLITQADKAQMKSSCTDIIEIMTELNQSYNLIATIYDKTSEIVGQEFLAVKQLNTLKKQFKHELATIKKEKNAQSAQTKYLALIQDPIGVSRQALKQAVAVAQEAKKWLMKAQTQLTQELPKTILQAKN